jgi:hypothetical protein
MIPTESSCMCIVPVTMLFVTYHKAWTKKMDWPSIVHLQKV